MQTTLDRVRERRVKVNEQAGFTLIELLIIMFVLAILAAIVLFGVQDLTGTTAKASCESDVQTTDHAFQDYFAQVGTYPKSIAELEQVAGNVTLSDGTTNSGPWLHNTPTNGTSYAIDMSTDISGTGPWTIKSPVVKGSTSTAPMIEVLGKWDSVHSDWTSETTYNPPKATAPAVSTPGAACSNL